jgi:hypothetical protein
MIEPSGSECVAAFTVIWLPYKLAARLNLYYTERPFSETSVERTDGELERRFRKRPLSATRLADVRGWSVCAVSEATQESRAV